MVSAEQASTTMLPGVERPFPPIMWITVASMGCVIIGGIYMASYLPKTAPLVLPIILAILAVALLTVDLVMLSRLRAFAWDTFSLVVRWALVAYAVIAGMLEYVFVVDGTRGSMLVIITAMLLIYAVDIPLLLAFSVARYQPVETTVAAY